MSGCREARTVAKSDVSSRAGASWLSGQRSLGARFSGARRQRWQGPSPRQFLCPHAGGVELSKQAHSKFEGQGLCAVEAWWRARERGVVRVRLRLAVRDASRRDGSERRESRHSAVFRPHSERPSAAPRGTLVPVVTPVIASPICHLTGLTTVLGSRRKVLRALLAMTSSAHR